MDIDALDALYATTDAAAAGTPQTPLPEGRYTASIFHSEFAVSSGGNPMLTLQLKIKDGPHAGRIHYYRKPITANTVPYLKKDLTIIGYAGTLAQLQDAAVRRGFHDTVLDINLRHKGIDDKGRPNIDCYINALVSKPTATPGQASDADNPPF